MSPTLRRFGAGAALVATLVGGVGAGSAAAATTSEEATASVEVGVEVPVRVERSCLRIPNLMIRTDNLIERITAEADTRGSLLWLDTQIERAESNGRDQLTEVLTNRRAVREATVPVLEQRRGELDDLADRCRDAGVEL